VHGHRRPERRHVVDGRPVDDALARRAAGEVLTGRGLPGGQVAARGATAAARADDLPQGGDVGVVVEDDAHEAVGRGGQRQRPERRVERSGGETLWQRGRRPAAGALGADPQPLVVVGALGAHALDGHDDLLDDEAARREPRRVRVGDVDVEQPQAQAAAEVLVRRGIRLVAHRLRAAAGDEDAELRELGEGGVDGAAAELGDVRRRPGVDLVGREVLGDLVGEGPEDRSALRGHPQPAGAQELAGIA
jgi:hypothetical protein